MLYIVGLGPGNQDLIAPRALEIIKKCEVVSGYTVYLELIDNLIQDKELIQTPMKQEAKRCDLALQAAREKDTVMVCSGDPGIYGMASLCYELNEKHQYNVDIEVVPGITAANSAAALLGAPLTHDYATISLSDLLTPLELIYQRVEYAAKSKFILAIYNPTSKKRKGYLTKAKEIVLEVAGDVNCGYVKNIERANQEIFVGKLSQLNEDDIDMFTTVIIGNESTRIIDNKLVTPRGYSL